jgi:hypothetical protein
MEQGRQEFDSWLFLFFIFAVTYKCRKFLFSLPLDINIILAHGACLISPVVILKPSIVEESYPDSLQEGVTKNQSNKILLVGIIAVILLVKILHVSRILTVILAL